MPVFSRPRRSMLYIPGDKPRALAKARDLAVDTLILDLEDAVAPESKAKARAAIAEAVRVGGYGEREILLRVSDLSAAEDFALAEELPIHGVVLPKVDRGETVVHAAMLTRLPLWCMIETPRGVLHAEHIAESSDRLAGFIVGTNDLAKELRARHRPDRAPLLPSLGLISLAARAHGLAAIDGVHLGLDDLDGLEAACRQGRDLGFDGKSLIHPAGIAIANRIFGPDADEIAAARRMVAAWDARPTGQGVARIEGAMVEQLHVDEAERLIALDEAIRQRT